jgi:hypothetical protein
MTVRCSLRIYPPCDRLAAGVMWVPSWLGLTGPKPLCRQHADLQRVNLLPLPDGTP